MKRLTVTALAAFVFISLASGCATVKDEVMDRHGKPAKEMSATIEPSGMLEPCLKLKPGETLKYAFSSTKPLDFNIHYHKDDKVNYPVWESKVKSGRGTFKAKADEYHCLMWINRSKEPVDLIYRTSEELQ